MVFTNNWNKYIWKYNHIQNKIKMYYKLWFKRLLELSTLKII